MNNKYNKTHYNNSGLHDIGEWVPTPTFLYRNWLYQKLISGTQGKEFLDIGCGNGYLLKYLSENDFSGTAIDISNKAIIAARKYLPKKSKIKLKLADFYKIKSNKKYDQVFCFEVLEHVPDEKKFVQQMSNVLKINGRLILSVPAHMRDWNKTDDLKGHLRRFEKKELKKLLKDNGFQIVHFWSYGFPLLRILRMINKKGSFIKQHEQKKSSNLTKESSIVQEYNPKFKFLVNPTILTPAFIFMDLFLKTDLGFGYAVEAIKKR